MRQLTGLISVMCFSSAGWGAETIREISWRDAKAKGELITGDVNTSDAEAAFDRVVVDNASGKTQTFLVWTLGNPGVARSNYALVGKVSCEDVHGTAYIEMMSYFADGGPFFSRTLGRDEPSRPLTGTTPWREFVLPFSVNDGSKRQPTRLDLNVHFEGRGRILLGPVRLIQYEPGEYPLASAAWWTDRQAGLWGGIGGSILGCVGALIGVLNSLGRGRALALGLLRFLFVFGLASGVLGILALAKSQPYSVYYPLLLGGLLCTILPLFLFKQVRQRYQAIELQRLHAADAA